MVKRALEKGVKGYFVENSAEHHLMEIVQTDVCTHTYILLPLSERSSLCELAFRNIVGKKEKMLVTIEFYQLSYI